MAFGPNGNLYVTNDGTGIAPAPTGEVIRLRDIEGWTSDEVCSALGRSAANQRVLLHRARSEVRSALERSLGRGAPPGGPLRGGVPPQATSG